MKKSILAAILVLFTIAALAVDLPVKVTYRKALTSGGYVLQFHNISEKTLPLKITLVNPTFETNKVFHITIEAFKSKEIGRLEGWEALAGYKITVENANFEPLHTMIKPD